MNAGCDGFSPLRPKRATAAYINKTDPAFTQSVLAHNEHGEKSCGWKP